MSVKTWVMLESSGAIPAGVQAAISHPGIEGVAFAQPWDAIETAPGVYDFTKVNQVAAIAVAAGKKMSLRIRAGAHTPSWAMGRTWIPTTGQAAGSTLPCPCETTGAPNATFLSSYTNLFNFAATWCLANNVSFLHCSWYGGLSAEIYETTELLGLPGCSSLNVRAAYLALLHMAQGLSSAITIEFPISGFTVPSGGLRGAIATEMGAHTNRGPQYLQENNLDDVGTWHPWPYPFAPHGNQMVHAQPPAPRTDEWNWNAVYANEASTFSDYVEIQFACFNTNANKALLYSNALAYAPPTTVISPAGIPSAGAFGNATILAQTSGTTQAYNWTQSGVHGGGFQDAMDCSHFTDGTLFSGVDVGGVVVSTDHGSSWATRSKGMYAKPDKGVATICSYANVIRNNHKVLMLTGNSVAGGSKVWLSVDEGQNWSIRASGGSIPVVHAGNNAGFPGLPPKHPRSVGRLVVIDESTATTYIYAVGHHNGVWRSTDDGATWTPIGLQEAGGHRWYARTIALLPNDPTRLLVGCYGVPAFPGDGGAYQLSGIRGATPTVLKLPSAPDQVEEFASVSPEMIIYAACGDFGVYRVSSLAVGLTPTFGNITNGLTASSGWCSIAGVGATTIYAGCANPVSGPDAGGGAAMFTNVVKSTNSGTTWSTLTNDSRNISLLLGGVGPTWWHSSIPSQMLGGAGFVASQIVVNPLNASEIYVCGRGGTWRSTDAGVHWFPAVFKMNAIVAHAMKADPSSAPRAYAGDTDWGSFVTTSKWTTIINRDLGQGVFAAAIDPSVIPAPYYAGGGNRDTNDGGEIQRYVNPVASNAFTALGLSTATTAAFGTNRRPMGLAVHDVAGDKVVVVAVDNGGIWRFAAGAWTNVVPRTQAMTQDLPQNAEYSVVWLKASPYVYVFDKGPGGLIGGVWRSANNGVTWTKFWDMLATGFVLGGFVEFTGYMAADPSTEGRLYVSSNTGLWRVDDARTGTVGAGIVPVNLNVARPGNLCVDATGALYVIQRPTAQGQLAAVLKSTDHGATFTDLADDTFRQAGMFTTGFDVGPSGDLYASTQGMGILSGSPGLPATPRTISVLGIGSAEAIGIPTILRTAGLQGISPVGIATTEAMGIPTITLGPPPVIDTTDAYFLPPAQIYHQPKRRFERMGIRSIRYQALLFTYRSNDENDEGGITIGSTAYRGGYWTGPLTTEQVAEITAAGLASRIRHVNTVGELPAWIE